jgi:hypothetical protein
MGWREDIHHFDMTRLTLVGWLVFLASAAVGISAAVVVGTYWDSWFPPRPGAGPRRGGPAGIAGAGGAIGFFFLVRGVLALAGMQIVLPVEDLSSLSDDQAITELRRQVTRARKWRLFFILLITLGCIVPCGLSVALASPDAPPSMGITLSWFFGVMAFVLPVIGIIGWVLMHGDLSTKRKELAEAEQGGSINERNIE